MPAIKRSLQKTTTITITLGRAECARVLREAFGAPANATVVLVDDYGNDIDDIRITWTETEHREDPE